MWLGCKINKFLKRRLPLRGIEMTQWTKALAAKAYNLSSVPEAPMEEESL